MKIFIRRVSWEKTVCLDTSLGPVKTLLDGVEVEIRMLLQPVHEYVSQSQDVEDVIPKLFEGLRNEHVSYL